MATTDLAMYTFAKGQQVEVEIYDPEGPPIAPEDSLQGKVTKIEKVDGETRVYVWGDHQRFILVLPGEV